jgi:hypothetical protein
VRPVLRPDGYGDKALPAELFTKGAAMKGQVLLWPEPDTNEPEREPLAANARISALPPDVVEDLARGLAAALVAQWQADHAVQNSAARSGSNYPRLVDPTKEPTL